MAETRTKRSRQLISDKWHQIESADNVFVQILSRLPTESLLEYKTVSKYWYKSICDKAFINLHLSRSRQNPLYIVNPYMDEVMKLHLMKPDGEVLKALTLPHFGNTSELYMVCSFNGLICCINSLSKEGDGEEEGGAMAYDLEIRICNPLTKQVLLLPRATPSYNIEPSIGVAYSTGIDEYKVFRIFCREEFEFSEFGESKTGHYECEVYSSRIGSWRSIGLVPEMPMRHSHSPFSSNHVFVGGRIYWLVASEDDDEIPGSILSVDLVGSFRTIRMPEYNESVRSEDRINAHSYLIDLEGCLSLVVLHTESMDIWVLKDEGGEPKWEEKFSDYAIFSGEKCVHFVSAWKNEILFMATDYWGTYNLSSRTWKTWEELSTRRLNPVAFTYTESLVPCGRLPDPGGRRRI